MRDALYVRVSTDEQAKSGYSIPDQLRELHRHADSNGYKVVDTLTDDGYSGADPTRPGMMKAMELAESGVMDVVLATKRGMLFRSRLQRLLMDQSLGEYSVKLVALNDTDHRIGDGVQDDYAEWEREIFTERSRAGKRQKAREGKIIARTRPPFRFTYNARRTNFAVDGTTMPGVRRMFELIGKEGSSLRKVRTTLDKDGVPTPSGSSFWNCITIRRILLSDLYKPYTVDELEGTVCPEVLASLDRTRRYGLWHYGKDRVTMRTTGKGRRFKRTRTEDRIAVMK